VRRGEGREAPFGEHARRERVRDVQGEVAVEGRAALGGDTSEGGERAEDEEQGGKVPLVGQAARASGGGGGREERKTAEGSGKGGDCSSLDLGLDRSTTGRCCWGPYRPLPALLHTLSRSCDQSTTYCLGQARCHSFSTGAVVPCSENGAETGISAWDGIDCVIQKQATYSPTGAMAYTICSCATPSFGTKSVTGPF
jgi:hypothetical protein